MTALGSTADRLGQSARQAPGRDGVTRNAFARIGIFVIGFVLVVLGAAAWLLSVLLTVPFMFAGLWVWSREFHWAHRLFGRFLGWGRSLWQRLRAHPVRWGVSTAVSLGCTTAAYWWWVA